MVIKIRINDLGFFFILICIGIFVASNVEEPFRKMVRDLYMFSSDYKIMFTGKGFFFLNGYFIFEFALFAPLFLYLSNKLRGNQRLIYFLISMALFFLTTFLICYYDSNLKVIECTTCKEGILVISKNSIKYNFIFSVSLIMSLIPITIKKISESVAKK